MKMPQISVEITEVRGELERRAFPMSELRVENRDGKPVIEGHAAVFNQKADIFGFTEEVAPGAFRDSIGTDDIRALFNHDSNFVLGRNRSKTLELAEDERGLFISNRPPETQWARDLLVSIERGDINQMSFGFRTLDDAWATVDGVPHRTLKRVQLFDVSPVTFPAYPQTDVGVAMRSMGQWLKREGKDFEAIAQFEVEAIAAAAARERDLQLKRLVSCKYGFKEVLVSQDLLEDSGVNIDAVLGAAVDQRIGRITNRHYITGDNG